MSLVTLSPRMPGGNVFLVAYPETSRQHDAPVGQPDLHASFLQSSDLNSKPILNRHRCRWRFLDTHIMVGYVDLTILPAKPYSSASPRRGLHRAAHRFPPNSPALPKNYADPLMAHLACVSCRVPHSIERNLRRCCRGQPADPRTTRRCLP